MFDDWNFRHMAVCQNLVPLVNIKIAGKWMFIPQKMVSIGIDPYPYLMIKSPFFRSWNPSMIKTSHDLKGLGVKKHPSNTTAGSQSW